MTTLLGIIHELIFCNLNFSKNFLPFPNVSEIHYFFPTKKLRKMWRRKHCLLLQFVICYLSLSYSLSPSSKSSFPSDENKLSIDYLCPASTNNNHFQAGLLSYPIKFFNKTLLSSSSSSPTSSITHLDHYSCTYSTSKLIFLLCYSYYSSSCSCCSPSSTPTL